MFLALTWSGVFVLVGLWSLAAWGIHEVGAWAIANTGALTGGAVGTASTGWPAWLAPWFPPELLLALTAMLASFGPALEALLAGAPSVLGGFTFSVWVVWALGTGLLVVLGVLLSLVIGVLRRARTGKVMQGAAGRMLR